MIPVSSKRPRRIAQWLKAFGLVAGLTLVSRFLGFIRDILLAAILGTGPVAVALMLALRLTSQLRGILAEGAFTAAFQPIDAGFPNRGLQGDKFRAEVLGWLILANLVLLASVLVAPGFVLLVFAPGYAPADEVYPIARELLRIIFPYLMCISIMAFFAARLSGRGRFAAFALGPSLLNLCMILGLLFEEQLSRSGHAAAWAVFVGGVLQVVFILRASTAAGIQVIWPALGLGKATRRFFKNLLPAMLSSGALQVAVMLDTILASMLTERTLAHLYFADRLYQLPIGLISVALGTVLLPELAKRQTSTTGEGPNPIVQALLICAMIGVPLSTSIWAFGEDIIRFLFERGTFTDADTQATAALLNGYALGLIPALMVRPLVVAFQAREDTTTPFRLLLISLVINAGCKVFLIEDFGPVALSLGTSAGMLVYAALLFILAPERSMNR